LEWPTERWVELAYKASAAKDTEVKDGARWWFDRGFNVVAVKYEDYGVSKKPLVEWRKWINQRQTLDEFENQPWNLADGFGVVCSYPNAEGLYLAVVDYDVKKVSEEAKKRGGELFNRFPTTQIERTISGGLHRVYLSRVKPRPVSQYHDSHALELIAGPKLCIMAPSKGYEKLNELEPAIVESAEDLFHEVLGAEVFCQVLGVEGTRKINKDINATLLEKWLREILDSGKLKVAGEGDNYIYCHCPFHPPDNHPSFVIHKHKLYAVDFHDGKVYSLKELMHALQLSVALPEPTLQRPVSRYLINLYEHRVAEQALMEAFKTLENSMRLPKHIRYVYAEYRWVKRQRFIYVEVGLHSPRDLRSLADLRVRAYFYIRNITSREVFSKDIPKLFKENLLKDEFNRFILVAPQLPSLEAKKFYQDVKRLKISVWETFKAYKIKGNRSKWARKIAKQLQEVETPTQLAEALASRVLDFLRYCVKPLLDLLRKLFPEAAELIAASIHVLWEEGLDVERVFAKDRGPPNMCKMR
jgi:hypothetical protein